MAVQHEHSTNVGEYAAAIAEQLGAGDGPRAAADGRILHDVGKVVVPDSILRKAGPLTEEEFEAIAVPRRRARSWWAGSRASIRSCRGSTTLTSASTAGLPRRPQGRRDSAGARIIAVADAYDSMTSKRTYRPAMSRRSARGASRAPARSSTRLRGRARALGRRDRGRAGGRGPRGQRQRRALGVQGPRSRRDRWRPPSWIDHRMGGQSRTVSEVAEGLAGSALPSRCFHVSPRCGV